MSVGPVAAAFGPEDVTGAEQGSEIEDHKNPEHEQLRIQKGGFVWARLALALALDGVQLRILYHSMDFRAQISRDLAAAV